MYKSIIRPWLFRIDAEKIHNEIITLLHVYRHLPPVKSFIRSVYRPKATPFQWQNLTFGTVWDSLRVSTRKQAVSTN